MNSNLIQKLLIKHIYDKKIKREENEIQFEIKGRKFENNIMWFWCCWPKFSKII